MAKATVKNKGRANKSFQRTERASASLQPSPPLNSSLCPQLILACLFIETGRLDKALKILRLEPSETLDKSPGALLPLLEDYCVLVLELQKDEYPEVLV